ncbi:MAG: hypothetical protein AB7F89_18210 [Pirellulaceae bacterium]
MAACSLIAAAGWAVGEEPEPPTLFSSCQAMRLEIYLGRLAIAPHHGGALRIDSEPGSVRQESLAGNNGCTEPWLRYEFAEGDESFSIHIVKFRHVTLRGEMRRGDTTYMWEYEQPSEGPLRFTMSSGEERCEVQAPTFWHLLLGEGPMCRETLVPVLQRLRPTWRLWETAERVQAELLRHGQEPRDLQRSEVERLVGQLSASRFQERQVAAQQLEKSGPAVIPHLEALLAAARQGQRCWSGEQRERLERVLETLRPLVADSPERVAEWLVDDEQVWLALMKAPEPATRKMAARQLARLRPEATGFDPDGEESNRQEQLAQLRLQLDRR